MKQILCFGDSNTYGYIPKAAKRYGWGTRWTSILNEKLGLGNYRVIEEGLCGRTTVFEDPLRDGRCGVKAIGSILETHSPLDLIIVMLGTNDCKTAYGASAEVIGKGISRLTEKIRYYAESSKILLISPIHLGDKVWQSEYDPEFSESSVEVSKKLAEVYRKISEKENMYFLDASDYAEPSDVDREHMDEKGHRKLADAVYGKINEIFN